jgi:hypothetical protein
MDENISNSHTEDESKRQKKCSNCSFIAVHQAFEYFWVHNRVPKI